MNSTRSHSGEVRPESVSDHSAGVVAPEKPTLIERLVQLVPLRYPFAALVWSILLGSPSFHLFEYIDHGSTTFALTLTQLYADFFFTLVPFYALLAVRYLRLRIIKAEPQIIPILSGGEAAYHSVFGRISHTLPVIVLALGMIVPILPAVLPKGSPPILLAYVLVSLFLNGLAVATLVWSYATSSWGLHLVGESQLKLKSFLEDRTMGARAIGSVALSLTVTYLTGILLVFLLFSGYFLTTLAIALIYAFVVLGIVMFFLPLNSLHKKMQEEKQSHQRNLSQQYLAVKNESQTFSGDDVPTGKVITGLLKMKDLEITERKLASTPTWPFDVQLLVKLITIVLSVTAALLARVIINVLRL